MTALLAVVAAWALLLPLASCELPRWHKLRPERLREKPLSEGPFAKVKTTGRLKSDVPIVDPPTRWAPSFKQCAGGSPQEPWSCQELPALALDAPGSAGPLATLRWTAPLGRQSSFSSTSRWAGHAVGSASGALCCMRTLGAPLCPVCFAALQARNNPSKAPLVLWMTGARGGCGGCGRPAQATAINQAADADVPGTQAARAAPPSSPSSTRTGPTRSTRRARAWWRRRGAGT